MGERVSLPPPHPLFKIFSLICSNFQGFPFIFTKKKNQIFMEVEGFFSSIIWMELCLITQCLCWSSLIPITYMWWNVTPSTNEKSCIVNFWIFVIIFKLDLQKWEFMLYENFIPTLCCWVIEKTKTQLGEIYIKLYKQKNW